MENDKIKQYLLNYPNMPHLTLAKLIYKEHPLEYNSIENVRSLIRYRTGNQGAARKKFIMSTDRRFIREFDPKYWNPFGFPDSDEKELDPFVIPKAYKRILMFGDTHVPYHSIEALTSMCKWAEDKDPDCIILNGDIIDLHQCSYFEKDPAKRHLADEILATEEFLLSIQNIFPKAKIYYKEGNHEARLTSMLRLKAPEFLGLNESRLDVILKLGEKGIEYIKDKRRILIDKLNILHGHELKGGIIQPVNPARGVFLRSGVTTIVNHFHRTSEHTEPNLTGKIVSCWSIGCMCELNQEYMPYGKANHGFAFVTVADDHFAVENKRVYKGRVL